MKPITVVAAIIERDGAFLLARRPEGTHLAGQWEFPGGKVHAHETHEEALRRELREELDLAGDIGPLVHAVIHAYPERTVELYFYRCGVRGEPKPMMGQALRWVPRPELAALPMPEADRELVTRLSSVSPERGRGSG